MSAAMQETLGDGGLPRAVLPAGLEDGAPAELRDAARVLDENHMLTGPHKAEVMKHYGELMARFRGNHDDDGEREEGGGAGGGAGAAISQEDHDFADEQVQAWVGEQRGDLQESWQGGGVVDRGGKGVVADADALYR